MLCLAIIIFVTPGHPHCRLALPPGVSIHLTLHLYIGFSAQYPALRTSHVAAQLSRREITHLRRYGIPQEGPAQGMLIVVPFSCIARARRHAMCAALTLTRR